MKKTFITASVMLFTIAMVVGFGYIDNNNGSRTVTPNTVYEPGPSSQFDLTAVYTDDFDGANDTNALKTRGYKVWRNGPGSAGLTAMWFQGNETVFPAYNGPSTGYVASNYNTSINNNAIDNWLVLPRISGGIYAGDSLYFRSQSPLSSTFPDSIRVMYSVSDSTPSGTWVELGRFKVNTLGIWERRGFRAPTTSVDGRFAIRYGCVDAGPLGNNTDYTGIDAMTIERNTTGITQIGTGLPSKFQLDQNYPNPFNPSTNFKFALPTAGNVSLVVYDANGKVVEEIVNGYYAAGNYNVNFNASKLSSGVYFYKLTSGSFTDAKRMILVK